MRIGILTLPLHTNYGGILQAWALQTILQRMGHCVDVFSIKKKKAHSPYSMPLVWASRITKKLIGKDSVPVFIEYHDQARYNRVNKSIITFIKKRIRSKVIRNITDISDRKYDAIIVGSDQIWRRQYIQDLWRFVDPADAFLHGNDGNFLRIAYSASLGHDKWEYLTDETNRIKKALNRFNAISVREDSAVSILKEHAGVESEWLIDPTMLLNAEDYRSLLGIKETTDQRTIVSYILDPSDEKSAIIEQVRTSRGDASYQELNIRDYNTPKLSIEEWVSGIANAEIVVTDSFHGCVFSIIFNKPLIFIPNMERGNTRFDSLIKRFGINGNLITANTNLALSNNFQIPDQAQKAITENREKSLSFIRKALSQNL